MTLLQIDDSPAATPLFEFNGLADSLSSILARERENAFVLGLHGPWGSGKTTLMNAIRSRVGNDAIIVDFNAWKYHGKEALWRALILRVVDALRKVSSASAIDANIERSLYESFSLQERGPLTVNWTSIATEAVLLSISLGAVGLGGGILKSIGEYVRKWFGIEPDKEGAEDAAKRVERVAGIFQRETTARHIRQVSSIEQFLTTFRDLTATLSKGRKIYVFVDDLDRCLPDGALEIFEAIRLFLDAPECRYVVAVDRAVIRLGLDLRYPRGNSSGSLPTVNADEYIEKAISLSFDLPVLAPADCIELVETVRLSSSLTKMQIQAIVLALGTNPRRVKRFMALISVWMDIAKTIDGSESTRIFSPAREADKDLFLKLALIGYQNSAVIAQMQRDPGLAERLQQVANRAAAAANERLAREQRIEALNGELPVIRDIAFDPELWRALSLPPNLIGATMLPAALRWFRSISAASADGAVGKQG